MFATHNNFLLQAIKYYVKHFQRSTFVWHSILNVSVSSCQKCTTMHNGREHTMTTVHNEREHTMTAVHNGCEHTMATVHNGCEQRMAAIHSGHKHTMTTVQNGREHPMTWSWLPNFSLVKEPMSSLLREKKNHPSFHDPLSSWFTLLPFRSPITSTILLHTNYCTDRHIEAPHR